MGNVERTDGIGRKRRILHWHGDGRDLRIVVLDELITSQPRFFFLLTDAPRAQHTPLDGSHERIQVRALPLSVTVSVTHELLREVGHDSRIRQVSLEVLTE